MSLLNDFVNLNLPDSNKVIAEYIWIGGGSELDLRSKARTLSGPVTGPGKLPKWNYDGSSTKQAPGDDSEIIIHPRAIFKDPFRRGNHIMVMCDAYKAGGQPIASNKRFNAVKIFDHPDVAAEETWYGIEQEYTLLQRDINWPLGWPVGGFPGPQGPYYCGVGANRAFGRDIVDAHYKACLYAGIQISGVNAEVMPGQIRYGIEQEYTLLQRDINWPLGWPVGGFPGPQGPYYCGVGANRAFGRDIVDAHYKACLYAGIQISGVNAEVMPGQWEFQVGPCLGISAGDQLWVARYILMRIAEIAGVIVTFDPKPIKGNWNGAGAHTNYSTKSMRNEGGLEVIKKAVEKLGKRHIEHIAAYGEGNERRLTGNHETADIKNFSWGIADRGSSIRIGREVEKDGKGYFEDRRPASNMDPYVVTSMIAETTILGKS